MPFLDSLDIANRACQHCGVNPILSVTEDTTNNNEISAVYDKVRRAELRRNAWRFAIRKTVIRPVTPTMVEVAPSAYDATKVYLQGELVTDANGLIWISQVADNFNNTPGGNNNSWDMYFGPLTVDVWSSPTVNSLTGYMAGELVYVLNPAVASGYRIFMSLANNNTDTPNLTQAWSATTQYIQDEVVSYSGSTWRSLSPVNLNNIPGSSTFWANTPTLIAQDQSWRYITSGLKNLFLSWPT